jgi:O-phosphoseryl-tRNA(Cys) synthetase
MKQSHVREKIMTVKIEMKKKTVKIKTCERKRNKKVSGNKKIGHLYMHVGYIYVYI